MDSVHDVPGNCVRRQHVPKELSDDAESIGLESMYRFIVLCELLVEEALPHAIQLAQPFTDKTKELAECSFLRGTFDKHRGQFVL